ncbi:MAG: hypothetical protein JWQ23_2104 [Herminiimonas sp.]|nr:hypothetical protein [Herminiimonas sp.]
MKPAGMKRPLTVGFSQTLPPFRFQCGANPFSRMPFEKTVAAKGCKVRRHVHVDGSFPAEDSRLKIQGDGRVAEF